MPIDHASIHVTEAQYEEALKIYLAALKPLNYEIKMQFGPTVTGLGPATDSIEGYKPADFWLIGVKETPSTGSHLAFRTQGQFHISQFCLHPTVFLSLVKGQSLTQIINQSDRATVDAFHAAAIEAGAKDNGAPGPRAHYHPNYYGAFFTDPAGNNIEAVCHKPE